MRLLSLITAIALFLPGAVLAQSVGLLVGTGNYANLPDVDRGTRISVAISALQEAGMETTFLGDASQEDLTGALASFSQQLAQSDAALVVLSGRFIQSATETYYVPADGSAGPLATMHRTSLPLSTVFALLSEKPGKAVLVLATDDRTGGLGQGLAYGVGSLDIPQGVTVIIGNPRRTSDVVERNIAQPGRPFVGAARQGRVTILGFAPDTLIFLDGSTPPPQTANDRLEDIRDWRQASDANTVEAYEGYIDAHPEGEFVDMAENRIRSLTDTPAARAEREEQSLDLNRQARRAIQRNLSLLGFDTRGIDGIFGRGTRTAVSEWQRRERFDVTGYLTREQIALMDEQARRRAEELEAEAELRRERQRAADLDYWSETGSRGDEAGLRAYLERFPDGEFADLAQERLAVFEEQKRERASRRDRLLWEEATDIDTAAAYERYLVESPDGAFRAEAQARIVALQREAEFSEEAQAEEAMNLSAGTRRIIESRLEGLGLKPGPVDGVFDDDTRRAIRRYQASRNLPESGYVSDQMMVQLMADTVRQIFR